MRPQTLPLLLLLFTSCGNQVDDTLSVVKPPPLPHPPAKALLREQALPDEQALKLWQWNPAEIPLNRRTLILWLAQKLEKPLVPIDTQHRFLDLMNKDQLLSVVLNQSEMPWDGVFKTEKSRFYPDKPITREELCVLAYQLAKAPEVPALEEDGFEDLMDLNRLSPKAQPAIRWAMQSGLVANAFEETSESLSITGFHPKKPVNWEQALRALEPILISIGQVEESGK